MHRFSLEHLSNDALAHALIATAGRERQSTATLLAHIAEFDERRLYLPAACSSMHRYCVDRLHLSEDAAAKRIQAARAAREYPAIFDMIADGRLHLTAVVRLAPHLTPGNAAELLESAANRSKAEIERLLAEMFPSTESLPLVVEQTGVSSARQQQVPEPVVVANSQPVPEPVVRDPQPRALAGRRFVLTLTVPETTHEKLARARALLAHAAPAADDAEVLDRALDALITRLEARKCGKASTPRQRIRPTTTARHIPAHVRRTVWQRDGGRCTFHSDDGRRCDARAALEYDHALPVARGGESTVDNVRLRCRAHNQFAAEQVFGVSFMAAKREEAQAPRSPHERDVIAALLELGYRKTQARAQAAIACAALPEDATLDQCVRRALHDLRPPHQTFTPAELTAKHGVPCVRDDAVRLPEFAEPLAHL